jgi:sec-independent protein translocase protein TatC
VLSAFLSFYVALFLVMPYLLFEIWAFVAPALLPQERRAIVPSLYLGLVLFLMGAALAYFVVLPLALSFMMGFQVGTLEPNIIASAYLSFVVRLLLSFGIAFELPVVLLVLASLGMIDAESLVGKRRYAIAGSAVLAAILTPGDVISTVLLMIPLIMLYELSILMIRVIDRKREAAAAAPADDPLEAS